MLESLTSIISLASFKSGVKTRFEAFVDHCDHVKAYYKRRDARRSRALRSTHPPRAPSPTPDVHQTNLPHHLSLIARYLKEEDAELVLAAASPPSRTSPPDTDSDTSATSSPVPLRAGRKARTVHPETEGRLRRKRTGRKPTTGKTVEPSDALELGPCLEHLLQSGFMAFLVDKAEANDPPGMHHQTLNAFSLLIRNLAQSQALLAETNFGRSLTRLLGLPLPIVPQPRSPRSSSELGGPSQNLGVGAARTEAGTADEGRVAKTEKGGWWNAGGGGGGGGRKSRAGSAKPNPPALLKTPSATALAGQPRKLLNQDSAASLQSISSEEAASVFGGPVEPSPAPSGDLSLHPTPSASTQSTASSVAGPSRGGPSTGTDIWIGGLLETMEAGASGWFDDSESDDGGPDTNDDEDDPPAAFDDAASVRSAATSVSRRGPASRPESPAAHPPPPPSTLGSSLSWLLGTGGGTRPRGPDETRSLSRKTSASTIPASGPVRPPGHADPSAPPSRMASMTTLASSAGEPAGGAAARTATARQSPATASFTHIGAAAGNLANGLLRVLVKSPRLSRMFLETALPATAPHPTSPIVAVPSVTDTASRTGDAPTPAAADLAHWAHASDDAERVMSIPEIRQSLTAVPRRFRPLETAVELMGCRGALGRIGRETVMLALELVASVAKEWKKEIEMSDVNAPENQEMVDLYGDYVAYLVHHSQLPILLAQELAVRYTEIPGSRFHRTTQDRAGSLASDGFQEACHMTSSSDTSRSPATAPTIRHAVGAFLRFWRFVDNLVSVAADAALPKPTEEADLDDGASLEMDEVDELAGMDGNAMVRDEICAAVVKHFISPLIFREMLRGAVRHLLGPWAPRPSTAKKNVPEQKAIHALVISTFAGLLTAIESGANEKSSVPPLHDLDAYIFAARERSVEISIMLADGAERPTLHAWGTSDNADGGDPRVPLLLSKIPVVITALLGWKQRELLAIRSSLLLETLSHICELDGVLEISRLLMRTLRNITASASVRQSSAGSLSAPRQVVPPKPSKPLEKTPSAARLDLSHIPAMNPLHWILGGLEERTRESPTEVARTPSQVSLEPPAADKQSAKASWFAGASWASSATLFGSEPVIDSQAGDDIVGGKGLSHTDRPVAEEVRGPAFMLRAAGKAFAAALVVRFGASSAAPNISHLPWEDA
ncbi:hypothetical protein HDU96_010295 [Phlyctochytrium bullatum]|nr:hypothetical protein HDU96_010295 [Phlyctochytrium bullatum]